MDQTIVRNIPVSCEITEAVAKSLRKSPYKSFRRVSCEFRHGVLSLRRYLFSLHEKQIAQEARAGVNGVSRMVSEIEVD